MQPGKGTPEIINDFMKILNLHENLLPLVEEDKCKVVEEYFDLIKTKYPDYNSYAYKKSAVEIPEEIQEYEYYVEKMNAEIKELKKAIWDNRHTIRIMKLKQQVEVANRDKLPSGMDSRKKVILTPS